VIEADFIVAEDDDRATRLGYVLDHAARQGWQVAGRDNPETALAYCLLHREPTAGRRTNQTDLDEIQALLDALLTELDHDPVNNPGRCSPCGLCGVVTHIRQITQRAAHDQHLPPTSAGTTPNPGKD
jgi:hypothetical protein